MKDLGELEKGRKLIRSHEDLVIYQLAFGAAMEIFQLTK
jgi:hypothetical protein